MTKITIGARGSKLSISYVEKVKELLCAVPGNMKQQVFGEIKEHELVRKFIRHTREFGRS